MEHLIEFADVAKQIKAIEAELEALRAKARKLFSAVSEELGLNGEQRNAEAIVIESRRVPVQATSRAARIGETDFELTLRAVHEIGGAVSAEDVVTHLAPIKSIKVGSVSTYLSRGVREGRLERAGEKPPKFVATEKTLAAHPRRAKGKIPGELTDGALMSTRAALHQLLLETGHPVRVEELVKPLEKLRGIPYTHERPTSPIWSAISSDRKRLFITHDGWAGLVEWTPEVWSITRSDGGSRKTEEGAKPDDTE